MTIDEEITKFENTIKSKYKSNSNNLIYLRLSKLDNSQPKEEAIKEAILKLNSDFNNLLHKYNNLLTEGFKLFVEVKSAYKNSTREVFINMYDNYLFSNIQKASDILEIKQDKEKKNLYVVHFDRVSRVFLYGLLFHIIRKFRNINIYTLIEEQNTFEQTNKNILQEENLKQTLWVFQLILFNSQAEKHSEDLSNKIKNHQETF